MKDNSEIPWPLDQLRSRVLVFAITDEATHEYEQITKGYVELSTDEDGKNHTFHYLQVKDEQTNEVLMRSNLKIENNFGKQKGSIISWTDNEQPQYQQIALSFQKDRECDMFWRTICQKIGKSYLEINGMEKLDPPSVNNLNSILEKAKNSIDLMDYNIVHSKAILDGLKELFYELRNAGDQFGMGTISRIFNAIFTPAYSSNAIQTLLTRENFYLVLDLQQFKKNIDFRQIYQEKVGQYLKNKFCLPEEVFEKVQLSHRAVFYRQNVMDLAEDGLLESLMFMICKEAQAEIMSYLNRSKFLQTLINFKDYPNKSLNQEEYAINKQSSNPPAAQNQFTRDQLQFLHEAVIIHNQIPGEQIKQTFKQNLYQSRVLSFINLQIDQLNLKALEILYSITQIDKLKFFEYLIDNFRLNSTDNLLKSLMKLYLNHAQFRQGVIALIETLMPLFNLKKELLDFFIGTFVCSVFAVAKDSRAILLLANLLLAQLENSSIIFPQLIKLKICEKLASQYRNGTAFKTKSQQLQMVKFLKFVIIEQSHKGQSKNKQIEKILVDSGLMECCMMVYMKHSLKYNIISSSMLQNLKIIQKMDPSELHAFIVKEYANNQSFSHNQALSKIFNPIKKKYIDYMNKKIHDNSKDQEYLQVQRMAHEQILENQQQDTYLMNEDYDEPLTVKMNGVGQAGRDLVNDQTVHRTEVNSGKEIKKEDSLTFLKRMMEEIKEEEDLGERGPRKVVKVSEDSKQTAIQFCFDLPDMEEIGTEQLQGT